MTEDFGTQIRTSESVPAGAQPLYEQEEHLAGLHRVLAECLTGTTRFAVVSGPAGCGKTRLLRTFAAQVVASGAVYLGATASRAEHLVPFGVLSQLFRDAKSAFPSAGPGIPRLADGGTLGGEDVQTEASPLSAGVVNGVCLPMVDLVEHSRRPVVIGIEDFQHADAVSLQCLAAVVRRLARTPLLIVLSESSDRSSADTVLQAGLPPDAYARRIRLRPLSQDGVVTLLARHLGPHPARRLAAEAYAITGGNPLILRGLIADQHRTEAASPSLIVDHGFNEALLACLYRCGAQALALARCTALMDDSATPRLLGQLTGIETESVIRTISALNSAGILAAGTFRHPQARAAVVNSMAAEKHAELRALIADSLYQAGAPPTAVARQLLAVGRVSADWAVPVLVEAATQALHDGEPDLARDCLLLAREADTDDEALKAALMATLFQTEWRMDPSAAVRRLPPLADTARSGLLTGAHNSIPVHSPLWFGDVGSAVSSLTDISASPQAQARVPETLALIHCSRLWMRVTYPAVPAGVESPADTIGQVPEGTPDALASQLRGAVLLNDVFTRGPDAAAADEAERLLRRYRLGERTAAALVASVLVLIFADRLTEAERSCQRLIAEATDLSAPTWRALFTSLLSEVALQQGEFADATEHARTALTMLSRKGWGVAIGAPLSVLLNAHTALGEYDAALDTLEIPVPDAMFQTPVGLFYMLARGSYHLATSQLSAALDAFLTVGTLTRKWQMDFPALLPWRGGAAEVYLRLGRAQQARDLAHEQLDRCGPRHGQARRAALEVLAAARNTPSTVYGETANRRAQMLPLGGAGLRDRKGGEAESLPLLSSAESRVAALAARGHSNRQIARRLCITISTVEQHLTRVYRKLNVKRRTDLPSDLCLIGSPPTGGPPDLEPSAYRHRIA
ncbi:AAA family ATPase [Streptomyces sp. NPDC087532]|uniref:helix-turn-helix transcriptional regulator n=1 Tax=unclassified Streptomyces TaxID=2593676 RepID=UPI003426C0E2